MAASAFAGSKNSEVQCHIIYGVEIFPEVGEPAADPYSVKGQNLGRYFECKIVCIAEPALQA